MKIGHTTEERKAHEQICISECNPKHTEPVCWHYNIFTRVIKISETTTCMKRVRKNPQDYIIVFVKLSPKCLNQKWKSKVDSETNSFPDGTENDELTRNTKSQHHDEKGSITSNKYFHPFLSSHLHNHQTTTAKYRTNHINRICCHSQSVVCRHKHVKGVPCTTQHDQLEWLRDVKDYLKILINLNNVLLS